MRVTPYFLIGRYQGASKFFCCRNYHSVCRIFVQGFRQSGCTQDRISRSGWIPIVICRLLEENLRSQDGKGDADDVSRLMDVLNAAQHNFHEVLAPIVEQAGAEATVEPDPVAAQQVIDHLILLQEKDDGNE